MDIYEQAVMAHSASISDFARREFARTGRGLVALVLAPDSYSLRYVPVDGNQAAGPMERPMQMASDYDPATTAVVLVCEARGNHDDAKVAIFMELLPDSGGRGFASGIELSPGAPAQAGLLIGEDNAFLNRNGEALTAIAKEGFRAKRAGAVVVVRHNLPESHWLIGHRRGKLPPDEGSQAFYVPLERLREGPIESLHDLASYDEKSEAIIIFLRPDEMAMTYEIGLH